MFLYRVFGLVVSSDRALPGLFPVPESHLIDLTIQFIGHASLPLALTPRTGWYAGREPDPERLAPVGTRWLGSADNELFLQIRFGGATEYTEFTLDKETRRAWVCWSPGTPFSDVVTLFLRPVLGIILLTRTKTLLHGSLVRINDHAIAILGPSGAGKSTLAAAFAQRGHSILGDDIVLLVERDSHFLVHPAFPSIALTSDTTASLFNSAEMLPSLWSAGGKRELGLVPASESTENRFEQVPLPLGAIYCLMPRRVALDSPTIKPVSSASAALTLLANRYNRGTPSKESQAREFAVLTRLAARVPVKHLECPDDLARLPLAYDAVLEDAAMLLQRHQPSAGQLASSLQPPND